MVQQNVDGTLDDTSAPTGSDVEAADYCCSFLIYDTDEEQRKTEIFSLLGVRSAYFYIKNNTSSTIDWVSSAITVKVEPVTMAT